MTRFTIAAVLGLAACSATVSAANIGRQVYGFYTEVYLGIKYNTPNPSDVDGGYMGAWNCNLSTVPAPAVSLGGDGQYALQIGPTWNEQGGVFMQFGYNGSNNPAVLTNMSAYQNGTMTFMIKTSYDGAIALNDDIGFVQRTFSQLGIPIDGQWHQWSVALTTTVWAGQPGYPPISFSKIKNVVFSTIWDAAKPSGRYFTIDNVVWRKPSQSVSASFSATLKNCVTHAAASEITWSNVVLGSTTWKSADQYIELDFDYYLQNWGMQIYTDNKATDANPKYVGGKNPAGLVGYAAGIPEASSQTLAMCWRITDSTVTTPSIRQGAAGYPNRLWDANVTPNGDLYPCFFWMMDKSAVDDPLTTTVNEAFINGDDYVTIWDARGIHHAEGSNWGPACYPPNRIYLGANFTGGLTPRTYKSNKVTVELFYE